MTTISIRFPSHTLEELKRLAPILGFSGYQPLLRTYVNRGLQADRDRLERSAVLALVESLRKQGVSQEAIASALEEVSAATHVTIGLP
ncbi:MAG: hypothetical protein AAFX40_19885 [Cyanobacteria bacterium J06639_1]